MSDISGNCRVI